MNATLANCPQEYQTECPNLIVGLDINDSLRLVIAEADSGPEPVILERHCFRSLEGLQRYLQRPEIWQRIQVIAVYAGGGDPHRVSSWLYTQNLPAHRYQNPGWPAQALRLDEKLDFWELPQAYKLAYTLAFLSSYRLHSNRTVSRLSCQTHQLMEILNEFKHELACLTYAVGDGGCPQHHTWQCPF